MTRAAEAMTAAGCVLGAGLLGAQWVDRGDSTCTALYRIDQIEYWFTAGCRAAMVTRHAGVHLLAGVAVVLLVRLVRRELRAS